MNRYKIFAQMQCLALLSVAFVAGCGSDRQENSVIPITGIPTVSYTVPVSGAVKATPAKTVSKAATDVPINTKLSVTFSEAMDPSTITTTTFTLKQGSTAVSGSVTYSGVTAVFAPAKNLMVNTGYTAIITTGARDETGRAMTANYIWSFTTGASTDSTLPAVSDISPATNAVAVPVNRKVTAGFSEMMDPATITTSSFTLKVTSSGPTIAGIVTSVGTLATFVPTRNLAFNTSYTATITSAVKDLSGNGMAANFAYTFTTGGAVDTLPPTIRFTTPTQGSTGIAHNANINATFSEAMNPLSITVVTFKLTTPGLMPFTVNSVAGTVSYLGTTATFIPTNNLDANTLYSATITTRAKDLADNSVAADYVWSFTTGADPDVMPPAVTATTNANGASNVAVNTKAGATFSEAMDPLSITNANFTMKETVSGTSIAGTVSYSGVSAVFVPLTTLANEKSYTMTVKGGVTGAKDLAGNPLVNDSVWSWTTGVADLTAPVIILATPLDHASKVAVNSAVTVTFSEAMDPSTINTATFKVAGVSGSVSYDDIHKVATFTPASNFANGVTYTATMTTEASDLAGNALAADYVWNFTTVIFPPLIPLGSAASFGVMARSAIASSGASRINGDVALSPGTACGLGAGQVSGTIHINDAATTQAAIDLLAAYTAAKSLPAGVTLVAGTDLGGLVNGGAAGVLPPGTYTSGSTMLVTTPLTLDAKGNANASWLFQVGSSFTTTNNVLLANGAQAKNVYWVSTASATIGAGTIFNGNIIVGVSATGQADAVINGRILSGATTAGATSLDNTTVNVPAP